MKAAGDKAVAEKRQAPIESSPSEKRGPGTANYTTLTPQLPSSATMEDLYDEYVI